MAQLHLASLQDRLTGRLLLLVVSAGLSSEGHECLRLVFFEEIENELIHQIGLFHQEGMRCPRHDREFRFGIAL